MIANLIASLITASVLTGEGCLVACPQWLIASLITASVLTALNANEPQWLIASLITASVLTALNANELAKQTPMSESRRWLYRIAAVLILPIAIAIGYMPTLLVAAYYFGSVDLNDLDSLFTALYVVGVAVLLFPVMFIGSWSVMLAVMYKMLGLPSVVRVVSITVIACSLLFVVELYVRAVLLESGAFPIYLLIALGVPFLTVPLLRRWIAR